MTTVTDLKTFLELNTSALADIETLVLTDIHLPSNYFFSSFCNRISLCTNLKKFDFSKNKNFFQGWRMC